jgi:hypothetical protein
MTMCGIKEVIAKGKADEMVDMCYDKKSIVWKGN